MKCASFVLTILCLFLLTGQAHADFQTFGSADAKFKVDVPQGWKATPNDGGAQLTAPDGASSLSIQIQPRGDKTAKQLAELIGEQMKNSGAKIVNIEEENKDQAILYLEVEGTRVATMIHVNGDKFMAITMAGNDSETMKKIINSLDDAK